MLKRVAIVGGGAGGIALASRLMQQAGKVKVTVIESSAVHRYQPIWTLVGGGHSQLDARAQRPQQSVIPQSVNWLQSKVTAIDTGNKIVHLADERSVDYDYLVFACGIQTDWSAIDGLQEALTATVADGSYQHKNVCSNYVEDGRGAIKTREAIKAFAGGRALFTQPSTPIKCAGAP